MHTTKECETGHQVMGENDGMLGVCFDPLGRSRINRDYHRSGSGVSDGQRAEKDENESEGCCPDHP